MLRMVPEVDPPRPSTKVSTAEALPSIAASRDIKPAHFKRALKGDRDWIVMKALEKDSTRRYETANGFGADILRQLANEPVLAAPPGRAYRLRKFVHNNRGQVIAASLVLTALVVGIVGTTLGLFQARRQEQIAQTLATEEAAARGKAEDLVTKKLPVRVPPACGRCDCAYTITGYNLHKSVSVDPAHKSAQITEGMKNSVSYYGGDFPDRAQESTKEKARATRRNAG